MSPKVSVIVPVYNVSEYLGQCLDTILLQTLQDIEVICVDDGSTDDSLSILQTYAMFDERMKVIHQENAGPGAARNRGLKEATGEFICFMNAVDFYPENDVLQLLYEKSKEFSLDVCGGELALFDPSCPRLVQEFGESSGFVFEEDKIIEYPFYQFDEGVGRFIFNREFLLKNHLSFKDYVYGFETCFVVSALHAAKKFYGVHRVVYAQKTGIDFQIRWTKEKIENYCVALVDNLKVAYDHSYYKLKDICLNKLISVLSNHKKYLTSEKMLNILRKTSFLYGKQTEKVSIIIPVYNREKYLRACLNSALNQTLEDVEIICVDDGSTDNSLQILNEYAEKDKRILIITGEHKGAGVARNRAFEKANGEYILYLDSDDTIIPETAEYLYLYAKLHTLDIVPFAAKSYHEKTGEFYDEPYTTFSCLPKNYSPVLNARMARSFLPQMAVSAALTFYNRKFLENNNIFWSNLNYEDTLFFTESILNAHRFGILENQFYIRTMHSDSITGSISENYNDYCDVLFQTFEKVNMLADRSLLHYYIQYFLLKADNLLKTRLSPDLQEKYIPKFYELCFKTLKKYHLSLPPSVELFMTQYVKNKKSKKERISYYKSLYLTKILKSDYQIPFVSFRRFSGGFVLKVFGVPILFKRPHKYGTLLG